MNKYIYTGLQFNLNFSIYYGLGMNVKLQKEL